MSSSVSFPHPLKLSIFKPPSFIYKLSKQPYNPQISNNSLSQRHQQHQKYSLYSNNDITLRKYPIQLNLNNRETLQIYQWRKNLEQSSPIVKVLYIELIKHENKNNVIDVNVYTEHLQRNINTIKSINQPQLLYVLRETLKGYKQIFNKLNISTLMRMEDIQIGLNKQGRIKLWINHNLALNTMNLSSKSILLNDNQQNPNINNIINHKNQHEIILMIIQIILSLLKPSHTHINKQLRVFLNELLGVDIDRQGNRTNNLLRLTFDNCMEYIRLFILRNHQGILIPGNLGYLIGEYKIDSSKVSKTHKITNNNEINSKIHNSNNFNSNQFINQANQKINHQDNNNNNDPSKDKRQNKINFTNIREVQTQYSFNSLANLQNSKKFQSNYNNQMINDFKTEKLMVSENSSNENNDKQDYINSRQQTNPSMIRRQISAKQLTAFIPQRNNNNNYVNYNHFNRKLSSSSQSKHKALSQNQSMLKKIKEKQIKFDNIQNNQHNYKILLNIINEKNEHVIFEHMPDRMKQNNDENDKQKQKSNQQRLSIMIAPPFFSKIHNEKKHSQNKFKKADDLNSMKNMISSRKKSQNSHSSKSDITNRSHSLLSTHTQSFITNRINKSMKKQQRPQNRLQKSQQYYIKSKKKINNHNFNAFINRPDSKRNLIKGKKSNFLKPFQIFNKIPLNENCQTIRARSVSANIKQLSVNFLSSKDNGLMLKSQHERKYNMNNVKKQTTLQNLPQLVVIQKYCNRKQQHQNYNNNCSTNKSVAQYIEQRNSIDKISSNKSHDGGYKKYSFLNKTNYQSQTGQFIADKNDISMSIAPSSRMNFSYMSIDNKISNKRIDGVQGKDIQMKRSLMSKNRFGEFEEIVQNPSCKEIEEQNQSRSCDGSSLKNTQNLNQMVKKNVNPFINNLNMSINNNHHENLHSNVKNNNKTNKYIESLNLIELKPFLTRRQLINEESDLIQLQQIREKTEQLLLKNQWKKTITNLLINESTIFNQSIVEHNDSIVEPEHQIKLEKLDKLVNNMYFSIVKKGSEQKIYESIKNIERNLNILEDQYHKCGQSIAQK